MKTKTIVLSGLAVAALAVPALAQMDRGRPAPGPVTRADVEARVKDRFAKADLDRDGAVTKEEIERARAERKRERADRRFAMLDADRNGSISRAEFDNAEQMRAGRGGGMAQRRMMRRGMMARMGGERMFARADANSDGRVTLEEMMRPAMERFDRTDTNRDGTITPEERRDAREKMRAERMKQRA